MSDYMPYELLTKIFAYLPPKSLVRFTCVCKSWQSLITSSDFIADHLNQTTLSNNNSNSSSSSRNNLVLLRYPIHPNSERYSMHIDDDNGTFDRHEVLEFPFESFVFNEYFRILGSCNGLVCLSDDYGAITNTIVLWNPSIRKTFTLPPPQLTYLTRGEGYSHVLGFGFDSRTNDYKVVRLVFLESEAEESPRVELFRLSTGTWETIAATIDPMHLVYYSHWGQVFFNGAFHWPAFELGRGTLILSFDMRDEVFLEIMMPGKGIETRFVMDFRVAVYKGWLSFCHVVEDCVRSCSLWVMTEYGVVDSWTKLYSVDLDGDLGEIIGFRRNGEILLAMSNIKLVSYDPKTRQIKYLGACGSEGHSRPRDTIKHSFHVDAYMESLVLLDMPSDLGRGCDESEEEKEDHSCEESEEDNDDQAIVAGVSYQLMRTQLNMEEFQGVLIYLWVVTTIGVWLMRWLRRREPGNLVSWQPGKNVYKSFHLVQAPGFNFSYTQGVGH